jgi:isocitrate dehydrogenase (NAD+)
MLQIKTNKENSMENIITAQEKFADLIKSEYARIERMKADSEITDFSKLEKIVVGIMPGDGIGPIIMKEAIKVLNALIESEISSGKVEIRMIEGMTIENRAEKMQSLPDDVFEEIKKCHVLLKGPMVTPREGDPWPNLISANTMLRRELELFAAVRPIKIPEKNIDWAFFRENIEGEYIWGNKGIQVNEDLAIDFKVQTKQGSERIARAAFEYARKNGKKNVTVVTKSNIVKLNDGNFVKAVKRVGQEYPEIEVQEKLVDAMCAKMMDPEFCKGCEVFVLPNLYGDIVTDVVAEQQGGLGTASSSNIGNKYAMFEAIHGTAPFLISHGRGNYADPCSLIRAVGMLVAHIGYGDRKALLDKALDICTITERKHVVTTDKDGATAEEFADYLLETLKPML